MKVSGTSGIYKIGATVNIENRIARMEKKKAWKLECLRFIEVDGDFNECTRVENILHREYENYRLGNEWFVLPDDMVAEVLA